MNERIERSIITKFRKQIWSKFVKAVEEYNLIEENDKIAVCISGGKDSFLLSKLMLELKRHGKIKFDFVNILMNPGFTDENIDEIYNNAKLLNIELIEFNNNIFNEINGEKDLCYLCARKRRGALYAKAQSLGCNKIALGHHFNDVVETILMSMIYNGEFKTMMPKIKSTNFENMELIRPMYFIKECDIINFCNYNNLKFSTCACEFSKKDIGARNEIKKLVNNLNNIYKGADQNIMNSASNINLNTVISFKTEGGDNNGSNLGKNV